MLMLVRCYRYAVSCSEAGHVVLLQNWVIQHTVKGLAFLAVTSLVGLVAMEESEEVIFAAAWWMELFVLWLEGIREDMCLKME
jgi:hypothetical protein